VKDHCFYCWNDATHVWNDEFHDNLKVCRTHAPEGAPVLFAPKAV
jgi:hypothetical protein